MVYGRSMVQFIRYVFRGYNTTLDPGVILNSPDGNRLGNCPANDAILKMATNSPDAGRETASFVLSILLVLDARHEPLAGII